MTKPTPRDKSERAKRRRLRWLRANPLCAHCLRAGITTAAREVDHVVPLAKGGADNETNLQSLCIACHVQKSRADRGLAPRPKIGPDGWPITRGDE